MHKGNRNAGMSVRAAICCAVLLAMIVSFGAQAAENSCIVPEPPQDKALTDRHNSINERVKKGNVDLIFIGDSITRNWETTGKDAWEKYYQKRNAVNLGVGGDQTQHVLWRLDNGNIAGINPKLAVIMIGTNNATENTPQEIAEGVTAIVKRLRDKLPKTKVLVLGIFPREEKPGEIRANLARVNAIIAKAADGKMVSFMDIGSKFLQPDGTLPKDIMSDGVHPTAKGYEIWASAIEPAIAEMTGEKTGK